MCNIREQFMEMIGACNLFFLVPLNISIYKLSILSLEFVCGPAVQV